MKIFEAKRRIIKQRMLSIAIMSVSATFFVLALLKSIYVLMAGDTSAFAPISQSIQRVVEVIYQNSQFLSPFWHWAPVFNPQVLNTPGNYGMLFIILCFAISRVMWDSANNLSLRIAKTIQKVEELGWERELIGQKGSDTGLSHDLLQINIELDHKDQWYKRPVGLILLGVAIAVLGQWVNLQFGLIK